MGPSSETCLWSTLGSPDRAWSWLLAARLGLESDILPSPFLLLTEAPEHRDFRKHLTADLEEKAAAAGLGVSRGQSHRGHAHMLRGNSGNATPHMHGRMLRGPAQSLGTPLTGSEAQALSLGGHSTTGIQPGHFFLF